MQVTNDDTRTSAAISMRGQIIAAALLGMMIFLFAGFSPMQILHNAAHDTRHATSFPCH
ncbi:MAG: CbtB-domain containing protein [Rhizobiales bacterium]|nr:CbtB-domain containing protein [Hyphomicrobiales bacterium]